MRATVARWLGTDAVDLKINELAEAGARVVRDIERRLRRWTHPVRSAPHPVAGATTDLRRNKRELILENALLRHQLAVLSRDTRRPGIRTSDRLTVLTLARLLPRWREAMLLVKPDTVVTWHRRLFTIYWRRKSRPRPPKLRPGTASLIRRMALENRRWGAERIRGELLKLGVKVSKRTVQRIMWKARRDQDPTLGQSWRTFVNNHGRQLWACDFVQVHDLLFRAIFAFFIIDVPTRRVLHAAVTRCPTDRWTTQQLREATAWDRAPKYLLLDNDSKYGGEFEALAAHTGIRLVHSAVHVPVMNAVCERFIGSARRECLDHLLILTEAGMRHVVDEYVAYFNAQRPHQGLAQQIPNRSDDTTLKPASAQPPLAQQHRADKGVVSLPVLGGLHHHYYRRAA